MADVEKIIINEQSYPVKDVNAVSVLEQSLTAEQKAQVQANIGVTAATNVYTKSETDTLLNGKISTTAKGTSNGVAELDSNGKVPSSQLPSFVDDVVEGYYNTDNDRFYEESTFTTLIEPVAGKSWVDISTNKSYRWTGSVYTRVDEGVQIGETSDTAYAGNKGKANADAITAIKDGVSIDSFSDVETALAGKVDAVQGKGLSTNDYTSAEKTKLAELENYDDTGIQGDILAIEEVIPSTATSQNQLATAADIPTDDVKYTAQTLTDAQKTQARTNIGAGTSSFSGNYSDLTNPPPLAKDILYGAGGNTIGGTGGNVTNSARGINSFAYGKITDAAANYAFVFGEYAFAGNRNSNTGKHAVAIGKNVRAEKDYEIAFGTFNQSNDNTAFSIGDGTSDSDRHNLIELKTDGRMFLNGNAVKTEGEDDDNKLRLGTVFNNGKYGIGEEGSKSCNSVVFSTEYPSNSGESFVCKDFIVSLYSYAYTVVPFKGLATGKTTTGAWVHAENCYRMFYKIGTSSAVHVTTLDLSMIDTSEVRDMTEMFYGATYLTSLDLSSFDMSNVIEYTDMFTNDTALTTLKTPKINPHDDIPLWRTLYSQDGTAYTNLPVTTGTSIELRASWT